MRWSVLVVVIAFCTKAKPKSDATDAPIDAASVRDSGDPCDAFNQRLLERFRATIDALGDASPRVGAHWTRALLDTRLAETGLGCLPFARGAWMIDAVDPIDVTQSSNAIDTAANVKARVDGRAIDWGEAGAPYLSVSASSIKRRLVGDYDGDGLPELWLSESVVTESSHTRAWILSVRDGSIVEYAPAKTFDIVDDPIDVDGDGRFDLPVSLGVYTYEHACYWPAKQPAKFLAHAHASGTFSTTDGVALDFAKKWCPAFPATLKTSTDVLCAKMRTEPKDQASLRARIASCTVWDCDAERDGRAQKPGVTEACDALIQTFDQRIPVALR